MARGNQKIVAREKTDKKNRDKKHVNTLGGTEFQRVKESDAEKMRNKQKLADERKAAEALAAAKPKGNVTKQRLI